MNKIKKVKTYIDKIYEKCCNYRDKYGYKENLGYDQKNKVLDYMRKFNLTYQEECEVLRYFDIQIKDI